MIIARSKSNCNPLFSFFEVAVVTQPCYVPENPRSFLLCLHLEEELVEAGILVEFGVKGNAELVALAGGDDTAVDFC